MKRSLARPAKALILSFLITIAFFLAAEICVRIAAIEPGAWPVSDMPFKPPQIEVDPLLGPLPKAGWSGRWSGTFEVAIDEHGFRASGIPPPPHPERLVVFLGDSCTFGWRVNTRATFVAQLARIQEEAGNGRFAFLNAAYPGHSASVGVYMLRERVLPLHPDVVVLGYSANNAFRFSLMRDAERFRFFGLRKILLRSLLFHILAAKMVDRGNTRRLQPRNREAIASTPYERVERTAPIEDFEAAMRRMVADARATGAEVVFLSFPRASGVSRQFWSEDAALRARHQSRLGGGERSPTRETDLVEVSCLDQRKVENPRRVLLERVGGWEPVYPASRATRALLRKGASAYVAGETEEATATFEQAVELAPRSPLALYDLGVSLLASGQTERGLRELDEADRLACNVFLSYQVSLRKIAVDLGVPVVDLALHFQSRDGEDLFADAAHPNPLGHRIIAAALWKTLTDEGP